MATSILTEANLFQADLKGKDKFIKLIQYGARFFKYYSLGTMPNLAGQLELLEKILVVRVKYSVSVNFCRK